MLFKSNNTCYILYQFLCFLELRHKFFSLNWILYISEGTLIPFFFHIKYIYSHILFVSLHQIFTESTFLVTVLSFHFFLEREGTAIICWKKYWSKTLSQAHIMNLFVSVWYNKVTFWSLSHCYTSVVHISTHVFMVYDSLCDFLHV